MRRERRLASWSSLCACHVAFASRSFLSLSSSSARTRPALLSSARLACTCPCRFALSAFSRATSRSSAACAAAVSELACARIRSLFKALHCSTSSFSIWPRKSASSAETLWNSRACSRRCASATVSWERSSLRSSSSRLAASRLVSSEEKPVMLEVLALATSLASTWAGGAALACRSSTAKQRSSNAFLPLRWLAPLPLLMWLLFVARLLPVERSPRRENISSLEGAPFAAPHAEMVPLLEALAPPHTRPLRRPQSH
mmetsp:Transcript_1518/g.4301  ORF Transcript_1518/g.4301 Transcript_1518/m.4301 type:complete len:257 (-) Transcript_1518:1610-2380(-)